MIATHNQTLFYFCLQHLIRITSSIAFTICLDYFFILYYNRSIPFPFNRFSRTPFAIEPYFYWLEYSGFHLYFITTIIVFSSPSWGIVVEPLPSTYLSVLEIPITLGYLDAWTAIVTILRLLTIYHPYVFSTFVPSRLPFPVPLWCKALSTTCN